MPTIIDSLIVTLGLDSSKFNAGRAVVGSDLKKTATEANSAARSIEASGANAARFFSKLRNEALLLFGVFTASSGIKGFIEQSLGASAATGRLSTVIGANIETLSAWDHAVERAGGAAGSGAAAFKSLSQTLQSWALNPDDAGFLQYFRVLGVSMTDVNRQIRPTEDILIDMAKAIKGMPKPEAFAKLSGAGVSEDMINFLLLGEDSVRRRLETERKIGVTTKADAESATKLNYAWSGVGRSITRAATDVLTSFAPAVTQILNDIGAWLVNQAPGFKKWAGEVGAEIQKWVKEGGWDKLKTDLGWVAGKFGDIVEWLKKPAWPESLKWVEKMITGVGGLTNALEILFGLWLGSKFLGVIAGMGTMIRMLAVIPGSGVTAAAAALALSGDTAQNPEAKIPADPNKPGFLGQNGTAENWIRRRLPAWMGGRDGPAPSSAAPGQQSAAPVLGTGTADAPPLAATNLPREAHAMLKTIASGESGAGQPYNIRIGGSRFEDYSQFPPGSVEYAPGKFGNDSGRYQFVRSTWQRAANALGLKDFSPASQDQAAWWLAKEDYRSNAGRDLQADIASKDYERVRAGLENTWVSFKTGRGRSGFSGKMDRYAEPAPSSAAARPSAIPGDTPLGARPGDQVIPYRVPLWTAPNPSPVILPQPMQPAPGRQSSNSTSEMHIASIVINTMATDAKGIMRDLGDEMARYGWVAQADRGLA